MPAMRRARHAHLRIDGGIAPQQRQVAVGRRAGEDLDRALLLEPAKAGDQVRAVRPHEVFERRAVEGFPPLGEARHRRLGAALEPLAVFARRGDLRLEIADELAMEVGMSELLAQHRREPQRDAERSPGLRAVMEDLPQRQVGLRRGFVQPVHSMRPAAMVEHPWQVRVEDDGEVAGRQWDLRY